MLIFYDTCSLLSRQTEIFEKGEHFYLSNITINELENIKSSGTKDEETKYNARCLLHKLAENKDLYDIILFRNSYLDAIAEFDLPATPDTKIIACAYHLYSDPYDEYTKDTDKYFFTDDLACEAIAKSIGLPIFPKEELEDKEEYCGYIERDFTESELAYFYNTEIVTPANIYELLTNEYLIIKQNNRIVDKYKWNGHKYLQVPFIKFESKMFGKIVPKDGDIYQNLAMDSLKSNQITMIRGAAGTGKSYLAFGYMFDLLEKGVIDKIVVFCNTVATKGSAKLGLI